MSETEKAPTRLVVTVRATGWSVTVTDGESVDVTTENGTAHDAAQSALAAFKAKHGITSHASVTITT